MNFSFLLCLMEKEITFKERHKQIDKELMDVSKKVFRKSDLSASAICGKIAVNFDVTPQTVFNYATGSGKDGYLKDGILEAFKKLQ